MLSGILLEHLWWGSVFLINIPAMALLLVLGPVLLPEQRGSVVRFDVPGSVLSLGAVLPTVWGVKQWAADGFAGRDALAIAVGVVLGLAFWVRQRTAEHPMLDLALLRRPGFRAGVAYNLVVMFALIGDAVFLTQYLQSVLGMSPLRAALWSVAPSALVAGAAPVAAVLAQRFGRHRVLAGALLVAASGFAVLTRIPAVDGLVPALIGAALLAVGLVSAITLVTELAMISIDPQRAGSATAVLETGSELGGALGIAILGSIGAALYRSRIELPTGLSGQDAASARRTLAGALDLAGRTGGARHAARRDPARRPRRLRRGPAHRAGGRGGRPRRRCALRGAAGSARLGPRVTIGA